MLQLLKTWRKFIAIPALLLLSSVVWISNSREEKDRNFLDRAVVTATAPFQSGVTWVFRGVKHVWYGYFYFVGLRESQDALVAENDELRGKLAETWETKNENARLRKMLEFEKETPGKLLPASVIGVDSVAFAKSIRIDRGSRHGVARNMAVIIPSGVLGRVTEVSPLFSDVQLITDGRSAVSVRVQRTRAQGMLEGLGEGLCHLKYVSRAEDVERGDVVITSGLGGMAGQPGMFPRGLVVGTVVSTDKKDFGVLQDVQVKPAVDFEQLPDEVFVMVEVPAGPAPEATPANVAVKATPTALPQITQKETATPTPKAGGPDE